MHLELLKDWNGYKLGREFVAVPPGQARLMIARGIAKEVVKKNARRKTKAASSNKAGNRASNTSRGKKASRSRDK